VEFIDSTVLYRFQAVVIGGTWRCTRVGVLVRSSHDVSLGRNKTRDTNAIGDVLADFFLRRDKRSTLDVETEHVGFAGGFPSDQDRVLLWGGLEGDQRHGGCNGRHRCAQ
jgi:hypothetical protein